MDIEPDIFYSRSSDTIDSPGDEFNDIVGVEVSVDDADTLLCMQDVENEVDGDG